MHYTKPSFTLPATTPTKTPCAIHHIVKGKCLRCPHIVKEIVEADKGESNGTA